MTYSVQTAPNPLLGYIFGNKPAVKELRTALSEGNNPNNPSNPNTPHFHRKLLSNPDYRKKPSQERSRPNYTFLSDSEDSSWSTAPGDIPH